MSHETSVTPPPSRRLFLKTGAVGAGFGLPLALGVPAEAKARAARYNATAVPDRLTRHFANRFAYGITPNLAKEMKRAGGPEKWFKQQLYPQNIKDTRADNFTGWWYSLTATPTDLWARNESQVEGGWEAMANYARYRLMRRVYSKRQVQEIMTEFWENFLFVPIYDDGVFTYRAQYGMMIQSKALTSFEDLLFNAITHPAMGISLDNAASTKRGVNENLGRELLELFTVGQGQYSENDVKDSARIMTGYRVDTWRTWAAAYDPESHSTGPVTVMGFTHANSDPNGQAVTQAYLKYLAHHPKTAERVCRRLAQRFVSDTPSEKLVRQLTAVYLKENTSIKPVLLELVKSKEFQKSASKKVRTPTDDVVATYRALGVKVRKPSADDSCANAILWQASALGHQPYDWPRPDGPPDRAESWTSVSRILASFEMHWGMGGGWWPTKDAHHRAYKSWVPRLKKGGVRFDELVDHMSREILGRKSSAALLKACCQFTGVKPSEKINRKHEIVKWKMPYLILTLLDTPDHMTR